MSESRAQPRFRSPRRADQQEGDRSARERFRLPVTVRVILIGGTRGEREAAPDQQRADDVRGRLDGIRDERVAVAEDAGDQLHTSEDRVDKDADLGRACSCATA